MWTGTLHCHPVITATEASTMFWELKGDMLDGVQARESETLSHSPWRKEITSGSAKIFWVPEAGKKTHGRQWRAEGFEASSAFTPQVQPECRAKASGFRRYWTKKHVYGYGGYRQPERLDTPRQSPLSVTAVGPGLPALIGPSWHTLPHWDFRTRSPIISCHLLSSGVRFLQLPE